jgi:flagellar hook protein FlgE
MSFEIALSGINAVNTSLETISNNIANAGTYGFKSSRANFSSMLAGEQPSGSQVSSLTQAIDVGGGLLSTGRGMDVGIQGRGFFVTRDTTGQYLYTRAGVFSTSKDGYVVDSIGRKAQGFAALPGGGVGAMGDLKVPSGQIAAQATDLLNYVGNVSADWTAPSVSPFDHTDPHTFNASSLSVVYDSRGSQHTLSQYFLSSGANEVTVHYTFDGTDLGTTTTLSFGADGQLRSPSGRVPLALGTPAGAEPLSINVDYAGTTQFAGEATTLQNAANGYASGTLIGAQIAEDGSVLALYSNGQKQSVGTLALATFPAEDKLAPADETSWTTSVGSGNALYFRPGTGTAGKLVTASVEQSNVNMTGELVNLMTAQRNYQANTKVVSAENEMMKTLMQAV